MHANVYSISYPNQKFKEVLPLIPLVFGVVDVGTIDVVHDVDFVFDDLNGIKDKILDSWISMKNN